MFQSFFNGAFLGLLLAILIGPVFFALLETSIRKGFQQGTQLAIGIMASDLFYITITYAGLAQLINNELFKTILGIGGGTIMIAVGISAIFKKQETKQQNIDLPTLNKNDTFKNISKGFILNTINPSVLLFWIGAVSYVTLDLKYDTPNTITFFTGTLLVTFTTDLGKIYVANRIRKLLNNKLIMWLNIISGTGVFIFGIKLLYETILRNS